MAGDQAVKTRDFRRRPFGSRGGRHVGSRSASVRRDHSKQSIDSHTNNDRGGPGRIGISLATRPGRRRQRFGGFRGRSPKKAKPADSRLSIETATADDENKIKVDDENPGSSTGKQSTIVAVEEPAKLNQDALADEKRSAGKKRHRRAPKRKWKPYFKLTCEERRELEEREERRAERIRELRFKSGLPVAPYNTTQFLFDDLQRRSGNGQTGDDVDTIVESIRHRHHKRSEESGGAGVGEAASFDQNESNNNMDQTGAASSCDSLSSPRDYSNEFNVEEFEHDYDAAFVERLSALSRDQLTKEYLQLEKQYEMARRDADEAQAEVARLRRRLQQQQQGGAGGNDAESSRNTQ